MTRDELDHADADRLLLLDRIADRVPEIDLSQHSVAWTTLDDGSEALLVGGIVIRPDGSRVLARVMPDPLAQQKPN
jgi:hypothetical protein